MNALPGNAPLPSHGTSIGSHQSAVAAPAALGQTDAAENALPTYAAWGEAAAAQIAPAPQRLAGVLEAVPTEGIDAVQSSALEIGAVALPEAMSAEGLVEPEAVPQTLSPDAWQMLSSFAPSWQPEMRVPQGAWNAAAAVPVADLPEKTMSAPAAMQSAESSLQSAVALPQALSEWALRPDSVQGVVSPSRPLQTVVAETVRLAQQPMAERSVVSSSAARSLAMPMLSKATLSVAANTPAADGTTMPLPAYLAREGSEAPIAAALSSSANSVSSGAAQLASSVRAPVEAAVKAEQPMAQALAQRIQLQQAQGVDVAIVRLDPPQWGTLEVRIQQDGAGVQVLLQASHAEVGRQLNALAESLRQELQARTPGEASVVVAHSRQGANAQHGGQQREGYALWQQQEDEDIGQALGAWLAAASVAS